MLFNENGQELFWFLAVFGRTEMRRVPPGFWPPSRCGHEAHAAGVGADPLHVAGLLRVVLRAKSLTINNVADVAGFSDLSSISCLSLSDGSFYTASETANDEKEQNVAGLLPICCRFCCHLSR
jgi:hypothetical protein